MTADEILRSSENSALNNNQIVSHVTGKNARSGSTNKIKSFGALGLVTLMLVVFAVLFSSGNLIPAAISERLIEETDVQYADAVESKKIVFQQAMRTGDVPQNTIDILKQNGVEVEALDNGEQILKMGSKIITADDFVTEVSRDVNLYNAFNNATYSRAAYYYDESAKKVFRKIGTTRNNYSSDSDFSEVMDKLIGDGSNIKVNNVLLAEKNENGEVSSEYEGVGEDIDSRTNASELISAVGNKNIADNSAQATLNSADTLKVADTISKEQRSSLFFLGFMENISKMKAGEGNESKINDAMNYLYEKHETEVVDVKTGEVKKITGTALESPSLYAVLSGNKPESANIENYSSDRILKTIQNRTGGDNNVAISGTVASSKSDIGGAIGRFLNGGSESANVNTLEVVNKTVDNSLINNSYETIKGVDAGEFLVEGAINVGKELAKASGATAGDADAVSEYARLNMSVIAMDAAADRVNRSPFDITSKNTFLGSIIYDLAIMSSNASGSFLSNIGVVSGVINEAKNRLIPSSNADSTTGYLSEFGNCETYNTIGAVGSLQCAEVATFDPSTLNDPFNDPGFVDFVNNNTTLNSSGTRTVNRDSILADFILYNDERVTPLGVVDGGILESLNSNSSSISFVSDIVGMIKSFLGASNNDRRIASGAEYVNSSSNPNWQTYKYAQRYVSLARATESLRQYADDPTAYNNIQFFEGNRNPVIAFIDEYNNIAKYNPE